MTANSVREFMHIGRVIPPGQQVLTIPPTESVGAALQVMRERDYSQLPVMHGNRVVGSFTWRCFAYGVHVVPPAGTDPLATPVEDWLEDLQYVRPREELSAVLPVLAADGAVLVGDEDQLVAVVTLADVSDFLWATTEPFVLLRDVELAIRDLLRSACPTAEDLDRCIRDSGARFPAGAAGRVVGPDDLTFGGLLHLLRHEDAYGRYFASAFGSNPALTLGQLQPLKEFRNRTFHFSDELTKEEYDGLVATRRWLQRKLDLRRGVGA